jgi:hypothetical protein
MTKKKNWGWGQPLRVTDRNAGAAEPKKLLVKDLDVGQGFRLQDGCLRMRIADGWITFSPCGDAGPMVVAYRSSDCSHAWLGTVVEVVSLELIVG